MGLQMLIGDAKSAYGNKVKNQMDTAVNLTKSLFSSIGSFTANVFGAGFAGLSNFTQLKAAISNYSRKTKNVIAQYNANAKVSDTFKGKAADETRGFISATKELLQAYVSLVEKWNNELDDIYEKYTAGDKTLSNRVAQDTQTVKKHAQNVSIG